MLPVDDVLLIGECVSDNRKKSQREHFRNGQPVLRISFFPRGLSVSTLESVIERIQRASFSSFKVSYQRTRVKVVAEI